MKNVFDGKAVLITGGTGSLGKVLTRRILSGAHGRPRKIVVLSRDEAKQHAMRLEYLNIKNPTEEIIYANNNRLLNFIIGDVRDVTSIRSALRGIDIVVNAAALKQVPSCEYFPHEAVSTNVGGAHNLIRAISESGFGVKVVVGVSTDKACKPVNVMGMTKAIQERLFLNANLELPETRFVCVRYGNVLASRGSVIPLFHEQIKAGGPVTITSPEMTRFLLSLEMAVDTIVAAIASADRGDIFIPQVPAARITDLAKILIDKRPIEIVFTAIRPGEKLHESLVSEEEAVRTFDRNGYYVVRPSLPELRTSNEPGNPLGTELSSKDYLMSEAQLKVMLDYNRLMIGNVLEYEGDFLR